MVVACTTYTSLLIRRDIVLTPPRMTVVCGVRTKGVCNGIPRGTHQCRGGKETNREIVGLLTSIPGKL